MKIKLFVSSEIKPDWRSRCISFFTRRKYTHAGIIIDKTIYHATHKGVGIESLKIFESGHKFEQLIDVTEFVPNQSYAKGWCAGQIGKDYSETQLPGTIIKFLRKIPLLSKLLGDGKREMICSELTTRFCLECTRIDAFKKLDADYVTPHVFIITLLKFVENNKQLN